MTIKIIKYPNPSLRQPTRLVNLPPSEQLMSHIRDLQKALDIEKDGLAIASNQVLENGYRLFVVKDREDLNEIFPGGVCVNPFWKPRPVSKSVTEREGCLSFPGMIFDIPRWSDISVRFQDIDGNVVERDLNGIYARLVQHETDHLDGKLFIEALPKDAQIEIRNIVIRRKKAGTW